MFIIVPVQPSVSICKPNMFTEKRSARYIKSSTMPAPKSPPNRPPTAPDTVFLGLRLGQSFLPLTVLPTAYAITSVSAGTRNSKAMPAFLYGVEPDTPTCPTSMNALMPSENSNSAHGYSMMNIVDTALPLTYVLEKAVTKTVTSIIKANARKKPVMPAEYVLKKYCENQNAPKHATTVIRLSTTIGGLNMRLTALVSS